jgi:hypothetical protein
MTLEEKRQLVKEMTGLPKRKQEALEALLIADPARSEIIAVLLHLMSKTEFEKFVATIIVTKGI